jgi:hypothetical protein
MITDRACELQVQWPLWPRDRIFQTVRDLMEQGQFGDTDALLYDPATCPSQATTTDDEAPAQALSLCTTFGPPVPYDHQLSSPVGMVPGTINPCMTTYTHDPYIYERESVSALESQESHSTHGSDLDGSRYAYAGVQSVADLVPNDVQEAFVAPRAMSYVDVREAYSTYPGLQTRTRKFW